MKYLKIGLVLVFTVLLLLVFACNFPDSRKTFITTTTYKPPPTKTGPFLPTTALQPSERPIEITSVIFAAGQSTPGGPNLDITIKNIGNKTISDITVTLNNVGGHLPIALTLDFGTVESGATLTKRGILIGPLWRVYPGGTYSFIISGTLNGYSFEYPVDAYVGYAPQQ
jgi:hypothetical protein